MHTIRSLRTPLIGIFASLSLVLFAPGDIRAEAEEEILAAPPAVAASWDETSGYGAVEATRAAISALPAAPIAITSLVPSDVRWAPTLTAAAIAWDETSGYAAVEANRAAIRSASPASVPEDQAAPRSRGTRAESALLWAILFEDDAVVADGDDRIADAQCGAG